jgi:nitroreductase
LIALRRSISKRCLSEPGPSRTQLDELLTVATRVPDHRRLAPWRFLVFEGAARDAFNQRAVEIQKQENPEASQTMLADTAGYFTRAPVVIAVISSPDVTHKTPVWEQELSCGALCHNLLLAANASGWAGCWLTEWIAFSPGISQLLDLSEHERIAAFIYLGTAAAAPQERMRPDVSAKISRWQP